MTDHCWLTIDETADLLRVETRALADWRFRRTGPPYHKFGRNVRYKKSDLDAWISQGRHETRAARRDARAA